MSNVAEILEYDSLVAAAEPGATSLSRGFFARADSALRNAALSRNALGGLAAFADLAAILGAALGAGAGYNFAIYGWFSLNARSLGLSLFVALVFVAINIARRNYSASRYLELSGHARRTAAYWNLAFMFAAFLGFLERSDANPSRGVFISFYFAGLLALYATHALMARFVRNRALTGRLQATRIMIVGSAADLEVFARCGALKGAGKQIVGNCALSGDPASLERELATATRSARKSALDEITIVAPMACADVIDRCVRAFLQVPVRLTIHLAPAAEAPAMGAAASLQVSGPSVSSGDLLIKRGFDMIVASLTLTLALPLMLAVALAIKLETPGPVFFTQIRYGYNKRPFRIFKFRTMTAMEGGRHVAQATPNDFRVTRMGRLMRKFNIDELPQLANVLRGEMSLVGPRPHAIAHDRKFAKSIAIYERRHNIKPGITGWAQVNGLRGPTDTIEKIERRVKFDLHYIDNWTLWLDLRILVLTVFSRTAYRNAF